MSGILKAHRKAEALTKDNQAAEYLKARGFDIEWCGGEEWEPCGDGDCGGNPVYRVDNVPLCSRHLQDTVTVVKGWATEEAYDVYARGGV